MISASLFKIVWSVIKSKWFWIIGLAIGVIVLFFLWRKSLAEAYRWESNYDASTTFISEKSQQVILEKGEFKEKEKEWVSKLKKYKIPIRKIQYVHTVEWKTSGTDTVVVHDTIVKYGNEMVPAEYASKTTSDSCLFIEYIKPKGDSIGVINHQYTGSIDIVMHWERPKPKFFSWLSGKKTYVVTVKSPCFSDTSVTFNKLIKIK